MKSTQRSLVFSSISRVFGAIVYFRVGTNSTGHVLPVGVTRMVLTGSSI